MVLFRDFLSMDNVVTKILVLKNNSFCKYLTRDEFYLNPTMVHRLSSYGIGDMMIGTDDLQVEVEIKTQQLTTFLLLKTYLFLVVR